MPMLPPAPAMFSTMNCWPRRSDSFCPISRAMTSVGPPAANGTMMRTTLFGVGLGGCRTRGEQRHAQRRNPDECGLWLPHLAAVFLNVKRSALPPEGFIRLKEIKFLIQSRADLAAIPPDRVGELVNGPAGGPTGTLHAPRRYRVDRGSSARLACSGARASAARATARHFAEGGHPRLDQSIPAPSRTRQSTARGAGLKPARPSYRYRRRGSLRRFPRRGFWRRIPTRPTC